jgi:hypothetical protein
MNSSLQQYKANGKRKTLQAHGWDACTTWVCLGMDSLSPKKTLPLAFHRKTENRKLKNFF